MNQTSRRRWFQVRLSTAVLAMIGCGVVLAVVMARSNEFLSSDNFDTTNTGVVAPLDLGKLKEMAPAGGKIECNSFHWYGFPYVACRTMQRMVLDGDGYKPIGRAEIQHIWCGSLAVDAVVCLSPVILCSIALEWLLRRRDASRT